jgi:hypothetical protein
VVRRGVTPEINALSTALLVGSMGLVGLSLTAQGGGPLFTRAMGLGAAAGTILFGLSRATQAFGGGAFNPLALIWLAALLLVVWLWRAAPAWLADLREANAAGRWLAVFSLVVAGAAALISWALLVP